jgi:hypothetical protein
VVLLAGLGRRESASVVNTDVISLVFQAASVGQTTRRKGYGLPAGGGDTSADSAGCCTLRPKTVADTERSAANFSIELLAGDATDAH